MSELKDLILSGDINIEENTFWATNNLIIDRFSEVNKRFTDAVQKWAYTMGYTTLEENGVLYSDDIGPMAFISPAQKFIDDKILTPVSEGSTVCIFATGEDGIVTADAMPFITDLMKIVGGMTDGIRIWNLAAFTSEELGILDSATKPVAVVGIPAAPKDSNKPLEASDALGLALMIPSELVPEGGLRAANAYGIKQIESAEFINIVESAESVVPEAEAVVEGAAPEAVASDSVDIQIKRKE